MIFSDQNLKTGTHNLQIGNQNIEQVGKNCKEQYFKCLDKLFWEGHIQHIAKKLALFHFYTYVSLL